MKDREVSSASAIDSSLLLEREGGRVEGQRRREGGHNDDKRAFKHGF